MTRCDGIVVGMAVSHSRATPVVTHVHAVEVLALDLHGQTPSAAVDCTGRVHNCYGGQMFGRVVVGSSAFPTAFESTGAPFHDAVLFHL
jgi:hypothetical protein